MDANFSSILHKKTIFLFYTPIFTKHPHQFIYSTHLFNKIFIILQFFIISSHTTPLSHKLNTTNDHSIPNHHHHPPNYHHQGKHPFNPARLTPQPKNPLIKEWETKKPNHHPPNLKPTNQTTRNKGRVRWSERLRGDWREINGSGDWRWWREIRGCKRFNGFAGMMIWSNEKKGEWGESESNQRQWERNKILKYWMQVL